MTSPLASSSPARRKKHRYAERWGCQVCRFPMELGYFGLAAAGFPYLLSEIVGFSIQVLDFTNHRFKGAIVNIFCFLLVRM